MKELYTSPEMKIVCFEANEELANRISWDDLWNGTLIGGSPATGGTGVELP